MSIKRIEYSFVDITTKSNISIISAMIKDTLGTYRSGLTGSYINYRMKQGDSLTNIALDTECINEWYPTVRVRSKRVSPSPTSEPVENGTLATLLTQLYHTIANMKNELAQRDELIETLRVENAKLKAAKRSYAAPPQNVIEAMAVYGR
jgi:hypothetical protein